MINNLAKLKTLLKQQDNELSKITCCFTGHRPQFLPWRFNENDNRCVRMKLEVKKQIEIAITKGYKIFITGMALGFDMICAEIILELKKIYPNIKLIGAIPCKTQSKLWKLNDKQRYESILHKLDSIRCIYDDYNGNECMLERNQFMVNNSSLVIALFNGKNGGTQKTLKYAKQLNRNIILITP